MNISIRAHELLLWAINQRCAIRPRSSWIRASLSRAIRYNVDADDGLPGYLERGSHATITA